jgi:5-methylcytosine-specific restriction protein B
MYLVDLEVPPVTQSDNVRKYAYDNYIRPAQERGERVVRIRAGDVHTALKLKNRLPLICTALGAMKFRREYGLVLRSVEGPGESTTTTYVFELPV